MTRPIKAVPLALASALALAACETGVPIETPPVALAYASAFDQSRVGRGEPKTVRTFLNEELESYENPTEIIGADCHMSSREFEARLQTPALVEVPTIKGKPSPVKLRCTKGDLHAEGTLNPFIPVTVFVGDPVTALVATAASLAIAETRDRYSYVDGLKLNIWLD